MKLLCALLVFGILASFTFAFSESDIPPKCVAQGMTCVSDCCTAAGGTMDGAATSIETSCNYAPDKQNQFMYCIDSCRPDVLNCIAPNSDCAFSFQECSSACSSTICSNECMTNGMDCAISAAKSSPPASNPPASSNSYNYPSTNSNPGSSSSSGCCAPAFILLGLLGMAFFVSKK